MSRKDQLKAMLADEPSDTFLRYGLAMEHKKESEFEEAEKLFRGLMADEPPYVPAFFMLAQQFVSQEKTEQAKQLLSEGISQANQQGDLHAAGEMSELLQSL